MMPYPLTVFFDGACPICLREIRLMKRLDSHRRLEFCDFSIPGYEPASTGLEAANSGELFTRAGRMEKSSPVLKCSEPCGRPSVWGSWRG